MTPISRKHCWKSAPGYHIGKRPSRSRFDELFDKRMHFARYCLRPCNRVKCKTLSNDSPKQEMDTTGSPWKPYKASSQLLYIQKNKKWILYVPLYTQSYVGLYVLIFLLCIHCYNTTSLRAKKDEISDSYFKRYFVTGCISIRTLNERCRQCICSNCLSKRIVVINSLKYTHNHNCGRV